MRPDFIKVDRSLVQGIDRNRVKENILETFVNFARKMNSKVIAEGIETMEELGKVSRLGVHFGQGYFIAKPSFPLPSISLEAIECIEKHKRMENLPFSSRMTIGEITSPVKVFEADTLISTISQYFTQFHWDLGAVIVKNDRPVGLVMKEKLNQELVKLYGVALFWNKPINRLMEANPLIVESNDTIDLVAQMAISRDPIQVYDFVIVVKAGELIGTVSIQAILDFMTNVKVELVRVANPLTGLPGNTQINKELSLRLKEKVPFSLIYADLDYFKAFNDRYGFQRGDQVLKHVSDILQETISELGTANDFIGHIGGDDFVCITLAKNSVLVSEEIVRRFNEDVSQFYDSPEEMTIPILNREGYWTTLDGLSISLAVIECSDCSLLDLDKLSVISAKVKKESKKQMGSSITYYKSGKLEEVCN